MATKLIEQTSFKSFDGSVSIAAEHQRPDRYRHLESLSAEKPLIARGGGYSYSAASFGQDSRVQEMTKFDRFLEFDPQKLTLKLEAGVCLADLLAWAIKRGLYFPVIPGYPLITVGGCVAADVHGKNPFRDGTFGDWVKEITLFHPDKGYQLVSPETLPDLFHLTCGGFGLTGIITSVTLQLVELPSNRVDIARHPVSGLMDAVGLLSRDQGDFCYSWHDGTPGRNFGRGFVFSGRWAESEGEDTTLSFKPMTSETRGRLPFSIWNPVTARVANSVFRLTNLVGRGQETKKLLEVSFPFAGNTAFHRFFGRPGLREAQVLVADDRIERFLESLEAIVSSTRPPTMMLSMKRFAGRQQSLSMSGSGYLLAVDCFMNDKTDAFFQQLDELTIREQGQPNLTKDSRLPKRVAEQCIANYGRFRDGLNGYDPARLFRSELSARIGL